MVLLISINTINNIVLSSDVVIKHTLSEDILITSFNAKSVENWMHVVDVEQRFENLANIDPWGFKKWNCKAYKRIFSRLLIKK